MEAALSSAAVGLLARMLEHRSALSPLPAAADAVAGPDLARAELTEAGLIQDGAATARGRRVLDVLGDPDYQLTTLAMSRDFFLAGRYYGRGAGPEDGLVAFTPMVADDLTRISYPVERESIVGHLVRVIPQEEEQPFVEWQLRLPLSAGLAFLGAVDVLRHRALHLALGELEEPFDLQLDLPDVNTAFDRASGQAPSHDALSLVAQGLSIVPEEWKDDLETGLRLLADGGELTGEGPYEAGGRMTDLARRLRLDTGAVALRLTRREGVIPRWERFVLVVSQRLPCLAVELVALDDGQAGLNLMFLGRQQLMDLVGNFVLMMGERAAVAERATEPGPVCVQCGAALDPDQAFCEECGAPVAPAEALAQDERCCESCGEPLEPDSKFCDACGAKVE